MILLKSTNYKAANYVHFYIILLFSGPKLALCILFSKSLNLPYYEVSHLCETNEIVNFNLMLILDIIDRSRHNVGFPVVFSTRCESPLQFKENNL